MFTAIFWFSFSMTYNAELIVKSLVFYAEDTRARIVFIHETK